MRVEASRYFGRSAALLAALVGMGVVTLARAGAQESAIFTLQAVLRPDEKAVFATVESTDVVPARARIGGVIASLIVDEGDRVEAGQQIAVIGDEKLGLRLGALGANVRALAANREKAETDLARIRSLAERGIAAKAQLDGAQSAFDAADAAWSAARAERDVVVEQEREGGVLAPTSGVVLRVPVTDGSVVLPGEAVAEIAAEDYVLRLALPERHARSLAVGAPVRVDEAALSGAALGAGQVVRVYPRVANGRVIADARVEGLGAFFVGERVRVFVETEPRLVMIVPEALIATRYGVDFALVRGSDGSAHPVAVQRGRGAALEDGRPGVEILSGLSDGDELVAP